MENNIALSQIRSLSGRFKYFKISLIAYGIAWGVYMAYFIGVVAFFWFVSIGAEVFVVLFFLQTALLINLYIAYCVLLYRSNKNMERAGLKLETKGSMAVMGNFIPVVNLFSPYLALNEVLQASRFLADPNPSVQLHFDLKTGSLVKWWWGIFLVSLFVGPIYAIYMGITDEYFPVIAMLFMSFGHFGFFGGIFLIISGVLALKIFREITDTQEKLRANGGNSISVDLQDIARQQQK